jgi:hypothetical protein
VLNCLYLLLTPLPPPPPVLIGLDKPFNGTIVSPLNISRKEARRKFSRPPVIGYALAAYSLPAARLIRAVTILFVLLNAAFLHITSPYAS